MLDGEGLSQLLLAASTWVLPVLLGITLHEAAHAVAAARLGDDTAARQGRVTLNPLKHVDPFGTVVVPALLLITRAPILFGWARPVPVRFDRLRRPRRDGIVVAAAGPAANLLIALACALAIAALPGAVSGSDWLARMLSNAIVLNAMLAVFNLLPVPPLDGGRILMLALPRPLAVRLRGVERYGILVLLSLLFVIPVLGAQLGSDLDPLGEILLPPVRGVLDLLRWVAGL